MWITDMYSWYKVIQRITVNPTKMVLQPAQIINSLQINIYVNSKKLFFHLS